MNAIVTRTESQPVIKIVGIVERVTYHNEENGYTILRVKARNERDLLTVTGYLSSVIPGESLEGIGEWVQHKEFGRQFKAKSLRTIQPASLEGIERYLGSGMVKGIGPHFAKKLVKAFGTEVFDVIENNPSSLKTVEGIGPKRLEKITTAWRDQRVIRDIMVFLQSHGVSTSKAVRIFKTYGQDSVERVKTNPYQLARDIYGIGFKSADLIAEKLGIARDSIVRARAGVGHVLMERVGDGHCCYPEEKLLEESAKLLGIDEAVLRDAIAAEVQGNYLIRETIRDTPCLYPASIYRCENQVAELLSRLKEGRPPWGEVDGEKAIPWVEKKLELELHPLQREAVKEALGSKITIITGGPGTGKTTLTKALLTILKANNVEIALCSPTGRAAKRLSECTGLEAKTIHRLLKFDPKKRGFLHDESNPLVLDLLLIDEASMVDIQLFYSLLKALPPKAALVIVGDRDQLPSVGPGRVLGDLIESETIRTVRLTQIFRQAAQSEIIQAAHRINEGSFPDLKPKPGSDFFFLTVDDPEVAVPKIVELVKSRIPTKFGFDPIRDIQVLCPMQRGTLGARNLNLVLQKELNPNPVVQVERFGYTFAPKDKVMVMVNDYDKDVFNGDIGFIKEIDLEEQECLIDFDGREVIFEFGELDIVAPAYTVTIHKSQGSEYPAVILPIVTQHFMMLKRNLLYTGVTRGKKLVILVGQKKALAIAIKALGQGERWTNLSTLLVKKDKGMGTGLA